MKKIRLMLFSSLLLALFTVTSLLNVMASDNNDVDGSFESVGFNNPVELRGFELLDSQGNAAYALNPFQTYTVRLTLHDEDSIADVKSVALVFYYGQEETSDLGGLISGGTTNDGEVFVAQWERDNIESEPFAATAPAVFEIKSSGSSVDNVNDENEFTWAIQNSTTPAILADFNEELDTKTFTFEFEFRVSKVAPQTSAGEWRFGLSVVDGLFPNESSEDLTTSSALRVVSSGDPLEGPGTQFNMNWFGEVVIPEAMQIVWTDVVPPLDFGGENSLTTTDQIRFISNGSYERATAASDIWEIVGDPAADNSTKAALALGDLTEAQTFGLLAAISESSTYNLNRGDSRLSPSAAGDTQYTILGGNGRTEELGNSYVFEYYLALSEFFQNATYKGSIEIKINNSLNTASIGQTGYLSLQEALEAAQEGDVVSLLSNTTENLSLTTAASIEFNGFKVNGHLDVNFEGTHTITFSGFGILTGDLSVNAPDLTLDTNLTVLGETNIDAIGSNSFNTSGVHLGGILMQGPGRVNALNETVRPVIKINTTAPIIVDGLVDEVSIEVDDVSLTVNAALNRLEMNDKTSNNIVLGTNARVSAQNVVINVSTNAVYNSIQAALNEASEDNTLEVGLGTYEETLVLSTNGVILKGEGSTIKGNLTVKADDVTVTGFTFESVGSGTTRGLFVGKSDNLTVEDNVFDGFTTGITLQIAGGPPTNVNILNNIFKNNVAGIGSTDNVVGLIIEDNTFENNQEGIGLGGGVVLTDGENNVDIDWLFDNNSFTFDFDQNQYAIGDYRVSPMIKYAAADVILVFEGDSIQNAINAAPENSTVMVGPGEYAEDIAINKSITLIGAENYASHIVGASSGRPVRIDAGGVTFKGFKVSNESQTFTLNNPASNTKYASAIYIGSISEGEVLIEDNYITEVGIDSEAKSVWGIYGELGSSSSANVTLRGNVIENLSTNYLNTSEDRRRFNTRAITFERTSAQLNILNNTINDISHPTHAKAIHVMSSADIINNTISEIFTSNRTRGGVTNAIHLFGITGSGVEITITGNTISNLESHGEKNYVQPVHFDVDVSGEGHTVTITGNVLDALNPNDTDIFRTDTGGPGFRTVEMFLTVIPDGIDKQGALGIDPTEFLDNNTFKSSGETLSVVAFDDDNRFVAGDDRGDKAIGVVKPEITQQ